MPEAKKKWTEKGLKDRILGCTKKIGDARRAADEASADVLRDRRAEACRKLAERFNVWALINPEGKTEFVDRDEWEQRMIAYARRRGIIRRPRVDLDRPRTEPPTAPPAGDPPTPPTVPGA